MPKGILSAAFALALIAGAGSPAAAERDGQNQPKKEKMICKSQKVTGSRTKVNRICMTKDQWEQLAANTKKGLDEMGRSASGSGVCRFEDPNRTSPCF